MIKQAVIAIGMVTVAGTVSAGQMEGNMSAAADAAVGQSFTTLDANGNGQIDWSEAKNDIPRTVFKSADSNGDGALSKSEYRMAKAHGGTGAGTSGTDSMSGGSTGSMSYDMSGKSGSSY